MPARVDRPELPEADRGAVRLDHQPLPQLRAEAVPPVHPDLGHQPRALIRYYN